jgi:hypothetical protein
MSASAHALISLRWLTARSTGSAARSRRSRAEVGAFHQFPALAEADASRAPGLVYVGDGFDARKLQALYELRGSRRALESLFDMPLKLQLRRQPARPIEGLYLAPLRGSAFDLVARLDLLKPVLALYVSEHYFRAFLALPVADDVATHVNARGQDVDVVGLPVANSLPSVIISRGTALYLFLRNPVQVGAEPAAQ